MIREGDRYEEIKQLGQVRSIHHFIQWVKKNKSSMNTVQIRQAPWEQRNQPRSAAQ